MKSLLAFAAVVTSLGLIGCENVPATPVAAAPAPFTVAVIPDTQNYVDYSRQRADGFALDSSELFIAQMRDIASRSRSRGGDVVFAASVGDVWQHQTERIDPEHASRGFGFLENPYLAGELEVTDLAKSVEMPKAIEGYRILQEAGLPFGVAPGNHDYDAMWSDDRFPPDLEVPPEQLSLTPEHIGMLHIGGLDNFRSVFGDDGEFFRGRSWYVASFRGGASSAQVFEGGGYTFLHIALEMQADDAVVAWAASVIASRPGMPTIVTTHDYLDPRGERRASPLVDLDRLDPDHHNSAEELWSKLISQHDQIFLVLCGHHHGQSRRVDRNAFGHDVHQVLSDYQDRGQVGVDAGQPMHPRMRRPEPIGDGWYRLMQFDLGAATPRITVRTYSSHYERFSGELASYASWYRAHEQPEMTDAEFLGADEFEIPLTDFRARFGPPRVARARLESH